LVERVGRLDFVDYGHRAHRERVTLSWRGARCKMSDEIAKLALAAIARVLSLDLSEHCQHGWGDYKMDEESKALIRRARQLGLKVEPLYEGYTYLSQADYELELAAAPAHRDRLSG
jgi:hypothetical protein